MTRDEIIQWVIVNDEGGVANLAGDPGGVTNKGISQRLLDAIHARDPLNGFAKSVLDLTDNEIHLIYVSEFWEPIRGDQLPPSMALAMLDIAVNEGPHEAVLTLQRTLNVKVDGNLGPVTIVAAARGNQADRAEEFCAQRCTYYAGLAARSPQFVLGWMRRAVRVYAASVAALS